MRRILWNFLLTFALALGAFGSSARDVDLSIHGDCCETMCSEMPACSNMLMCQPCSASSAYLAQHSNLAPLHLLSFPDPGHDRALIGPVFAIWTPPD